MKQVNSLSICIPFIEAIAYMLKFSKFLKDLISSHKELEKISKVVLNEKCSATTCMSFLQKWEIWVD